MIVMMIIIMMFKMMMMIMVEIALDIITVNPFQDDSRMR